MRAKLILPFLILYLFCHLWPAQGHEVTAEGAWCWFADPRALHYENKKGTINKKKYLFFELVYGIINEL